MKDNPVKIGVYVCHCGSNIAGTVDVAKVREAIAQKPHVEIARDYKFMCSEPGQDLIIQDIKEKNLNRVIVASCSPLMHEPTFRKACEKANLNRYLFQMVNIREQCSWVHKDTERATQKAIDLISAAVNRVVYQESLKPVKLGINPNTLIVGGGIAGIQAALEIAESGNKVYLVEKDSTIGGKMARFDKTFPTLDCSACILTPKMVSVAQNENIELLSYSEIEEVEGTMGDYKVKVRKKARYVHDNCTSCGECSKACPVSVPNPFDENLSLRSAVYKTFPQAIPNTYVIDKEDRPPCRETCPIGQEAAGYVGLVAQERFEEAARLIREQNPLPIVCGRVCYHPCEGECNRQLVDDSVAIKNIKRFVIDWEMKNGGPQPPQIGQNRSEKVAIIGSGPSGLTCAHDLAIKGYKPVIFEKLSVPGGMLAVGIPEYRLPNSLLQKEIDYIKSLGVTIKTNSPLGSDLTLEDLKKQGYQAIFLAIGAHKSMKMNISGEDKYEGVYHGVDFLRNINLGQKQPMGKRVAVIGGGNTAVDAARTALRCGAEHVSILYRRTRKEMPAEEVEIQAAEEENVDVQYLVTPVEVLGESGKVTGLKCVKMKLGEPDSSGRRRPIPIEGSEHELDFDTVIMAVSQSPEVEYLDEKSSFKLTKWNTFEVNPQTLETNVEGIFAGGDVVNGPDTVITAMGDGKRAAEVIDKYINGEPLKGFTTPRPQPLPKRDENDRPHRYAPAFKNTPRKARTQMKALDPQTRKNNFEEVELGYTQEDAVKEASRCLHCGLCVECHACERVCEAEAIDHNMKDEIEEINVGQVLLTTGYTTLNSDSDALVPYGYGKFENVHTSLEFERMVNSTGPTDGNIRMKNGKEPRAIGIIHCVGSRDVNHHPYCSRVCCMYALKFAHLVKDRTDAEVYQFYIDMRSFGKGYEEFYSRILDEGVHVIRGKAAEVTRLPSQNGEGPLVIRCEDTLAKKYKEIPVDMVVLCNAIEPQPDAEKIRRLFSVSSSPDGFFLEKHPKLDPTSTATDGVYVAGCCQGPKDIPDSVAQASSAAARILAIISKGEVEVEPIQAFIDPELCAGCRLCNSLCPYRAISFDEEKGVSKVNEALCKGCGTCVASCPSSAAKAQHFSDQQIFAEIEGILK